ncbi:MAG: YggT family protein [Gammaproteobacteria bacterium]|nr:MAG: YggT family protein [Gammaproteobacteria bacterium]
MSPINNVLDFLIHVLFTSYIYAVIIRMLLGLTRADFYNPFSQFILSITNPVLTPLRKLLPSIGRIDTSAIVLILVLKFVELATRSFLISKQVLLTSLIVPSVFGVLNQVVNIFIFAIIILVVISWVAPHIHGQSNPITPILRSITEPLIRPARKLIPPVGVFDLSTFVVLLGLYCIKIFLHSF